ncbi:hypothetical protein BH10PSE5_BH10PSE5_33720 [soil metagenome]
MRSRHETGTDRRGFMKEAGGVVLAAQLPPSGARASEGSPDATDTLIIRSGQGFVPHTHDLWIPYAVLKAPPREGVKLISTLARGHSHEVTLSREQLATVNQGGTVSVMGGSHTFVLAVAQAVSDPIPNPPAQRRGV